MFVNVFSNWTDGTNVQYFQEVQVLSKSHSTPAVIKSVARLRFLAKFRSQGSVPRTKGFLKKFID